MKKNNKNKKLQGRRLSAWKIVLVCILLLICAIAVGLFAFLELYEPTVDKDGPYVSERDECGEFSLNYYSTLRKYHIVDALEKFRINVLSGVHKNFDDDFSRREGVYNFLVMGHDHVALNTDVIMIVSYEVKNGAVNIVQIPRDTYIEYNGYPNKINSTLAYMYNKAYRNGETDLYHAALRDTATLLEKTLNVQIDNYVLVNLQAFSNIVDIMGGVAIDVPADMDYDDIYQDLSIHIKKGYQVLDGKKAAEFIRFRSGYLQADLGRQDAQKLFMTALIKQLKENMTVDKVAKLAEQVMSHITTDMTISDMVYYAKSALSVDLENISMMTMPGEGINTFGGSYYVIYRKNALEIINKYFNVYNSAIPDALFDQEQWLTNENSAEINGIYYSDNGEYTVSDGSSISQNGIYIPRVYYVPKAETSEADTSADTSETDSVDTEIIDVTGDESSNTTDTDDIETREPSNTTDTDDIETREPDTEESDTSEETTAETDDLSDFYVSEEETDEAA